jgi:WD40 repeat protein
MKRYFVSKNLWFMAILLIGLSVGVIGGRNAGEAQTESDIRVVAWNHDGTRLAVGHDDGSIRIWNAITEQLEFTFQESHEVTRSLAWNHDGTLLASGGYDNLVRVWNTSNGSRIITLSGHTDPVRSITWSPDGFHLITQGIGVNDQLNQRAWDATSPTWDLISAERGKGIVDMAYSPEESQIAFASSGAEIDIVDASDLDVLGTITYPEGVGHAYDVYTLAWSPDGTRVVGGSLNGAVRIWDVTDVTTPQMLFDLRANDQPEVDWSKSTVVELRYSDTGNTLMAVSADGTVRFWDANTGEVLETLDLGASLHGAELSPDGRELAYGDLSQDEAPEIVCLGNWDISLGESVSMTQMLCGDESGATRTDARLSEIYQVAWSPNGDAIATVDDFALNIWDTTSGSLNLVEQIMIEGGARSLGWSPDGTKIAIGRFDSRISVWDTTNQQLTTSVEGHGHRVTAITWSSDGSQIFSFGVFEGGIITWNATTLEPLSYASVGGFDIDISPDGSSIVEATEGGVYFTDVATGRRLADRPDYDTAIYSVDWNPNTEYNTIAVGSSDGTVRIWDGSTFEEIDVFQGHTAAVTTVAFDSSGTRIASADFDGNIRFWDAQTGTTISIIEDGGNEFDWSPHGTHIAFANSENQLEVVCVGSERPEDLSEPAMRTPCDTVRETSPTYSWWAADGAERYQIVVKNSVETVYPLGEDGIWVEASDVCDGNSCQFLPSDSVLEPDTYSWTIRSYDADTDTYSEWQMPETTFEVIDSTP